MFISIWISLYWDADKSTVYIIFIIFTQLKTPMQACADKLLKEMVEYGYPPNFPDDQSNEIAQPAKVISQRIATHCNSLHHSIPNT